MAHNASEKIKKKKKYHVFMYFQVQAHHHA